MKQTFVIAAVLLFAARADAQAVGDSLIVNLKNGQRVAIPLSSIQKITFDSTSSESVQISPSSVSGVQVLPSFPNPSRTGTNIEFFIPTTGSVSISIYDNNGNLIRQIEAQNCIVGQNDITWDGLNDRGEPIMSGAYFYEVRFGNETQAKEMVVIK
jgi:flagellar hook assembly protein FlgD